MAELLPGEYSTPVKISLMIFGLILASVLTGGPANGQTNLMVEGLTNEKVSPAEIGFFQGNMPAVDFYNYYANKPDTGFESPGSCLVIPYKSPSNRLSLIIVLGDPETYLGGSGHLRISGLSSEASVELYDDPHEQGRNHYLFSPPVAHFHWSWRPGYADGVVISNVSMNSKLSLEFELPDHLNKVKVITGNRRNPEELKLAPETIINLFYPGENSKLEPEFSTPDIPLVGEKVVFDASATDAPANEIIQYAWDFDGDGNYSYVSHRPSAEHTFASDGRHLVSLKITDNRGNQVVKRKALTVIRKPLEATRQLSSDKVTPGKSVRSTVKVTARSPVSGIGIEETVPEGWQVTPEVSENLVFNPATDQWILTTKLEPGESKKIEYSLRPPSISGIPEEDLPKEAKLTGEVSSVSPKITEKIEGDSRLTLSRDTSPLSLLSHYDYEAGELDFERSETISKNQIEKAIEIWKNGGEIPGDRNEKIDFQLIKKALFYHQKGRETSREISHVSRADCDVFRRITTGLPDDQLLIGSESPLATDEGFFRLGVEVVIHPNDRTLMGVGLSEVLPARWKIVPKTKENLVYKSKTREWLVTRPILPGEKFSVEYDLLIPAEEKPKTYRLSGRLSESWSETSLDITRDTRLYLVTELPIKLVIARWNVETGELDTSLNNTVTKAQVEKATEFWVEGKPVPYSGGKEIDFATMKEIVAHNLEGKPVT